LKEVLGETPKVMADFNDKPFLEIIISYLKDQGIKRVVLCTGHEAQLVEDYFSGKDLGIDIEFSREEEPLGTGGAIKNAKRKIVSDSFFVLNGDSICDVDLISFLNFHMGKKALVSVVVSEVKENEDFGGIVLDDKCEIISFKEKEKTNSPQHVNAGVYCFEKNIFDLMPAENKFSLEYDLFPNLINKNIYGFCVDQEFLDIGTPERLVEAQKKQGKL
jgi:NDP-sugar pyrophosphorylase family protein